MSLLYFVIVILILLYFVIVCGEPVQKINSYIPSPSEFTCNMINVMKENARICAKNREWPMFPIFLR